MGTTRQLCLVCCALVPLGSTEGPLPRVEEDDLDSPWAPCVLRVCAFLQNGALRPQSRPWVATRGRDPESRPAVVTRSHDPQSRLGRRSRPLVATRGCDRMITGWSRLVVATRGPLCVPLASRLARTGRGRACSCAQASPGGVREVFEQTSTHRPT